MSMGGGAEKIHSIWIVCHGYGQLASDFIRSFEDIASSERLIVAPEGLSRFYLSGTDGRIGASWMTREERDNEIRDYLGYLNRLWEELQQTYPIHNAAVHILGFSQGAAAVCRWVHHNRVPCQRIILWGGGIPPEIIASPDSRLKSLPLLAVVGNRDQYLSPELVKTELAKYEQAGFSVEYRSFPGGHVIDQAVLADLAKG